MIRTRCLTSCALAVALIVSTTAHAADPEDLKQVDAGVDLYRKGAYAEASRVWEAVYRKLGPREGYLVGYDIALAQEKLGESKTPGAYTKAANYYQGFLAEVQARRERGDEIDNRTADDETKAKKHLDDLTRALGRIKVSSGGRTVGAVLDAEDERVAGFTAYVNPGEHKVTFKAGDKAEVKTITVGPGEEVEVAPTPEPRVEPTTSASAPPPPPPPPPPTKTVREVTHPFPAPVVFTVGGIAALSVLLPVFTYAHASSVKSDFYASTDPNQRASLTNDYATARTNAYVSLGVSLGLAAVTGALAAWYLLGTTERDVVQPVAAPTRGGAIAGVSASF